VDGDDYDEEDRHHLQSLGIIVLPVAEVENLLLLPNVSKAIAVAEGFTGKQLEEKLSVLSEAVLQSLDTEEKIEAVVVRYCQRRIDRMLKKIDLSGPKTVESLRIRYDACTKDLDFEAISATRSEEIHQAIAERDLSKLLSVYDNKQLLAIAASHLKGCRKDRFEGWISRSLLNNSCPELTAALVLHLPRVEPS
jgi:hypothetical protein